LRRRKRSRQLKRRRLPFKEKLYDTEKDGSKNQKIKGKETENTRGHSLLKKISERGGRSRKFGSF